MHDSSIRVLLVENNPTDVLLLRKALAEVRLVSFQLIDVAHPVEVQPYLSQAAVDIILLDLGLPDSQGLDTLLKLRRQTPRTPIIVLTDLADEELGLKALQAGAQDYLVKGQVEGQSLTRAIRYAIERQQAEATLATERQRLRTLIDNLPDHIYLKDTAGRFIAGNLAVAQTMGVETPEQLVGKTDFDFYPPEPAARYFATEQKVIRSGQPVIDHEEPLFDPAGQQGWLSTTQVPLQDSQGEVVGLVGISRNITTRRQAEAEIQRRNRELALLNQVIAASVSNEEPEIFLEIVCRELVQAFELSRATALLFEQEHTEVVVLAEAVAGAGPSALNLRLPIRRNPILTHLLGHEGPLEIADILHDSRLAPFHEQARYYEVASLLALPLVIDRNIIGGLYLCNSQPRHFLTEEINLAWSVADQVAGALARVRLTQLHQHLSAAIEQAGESIIITDLDGTFLFVNPAFERVSGYSRAEVIGQNPRLLKSGHHDAAFYAKLWATITAGQVWDGRFINQKKDGTLYTEEATITPVYGKNGAVMNYVRVSRDITHQLQLEEHYRQAQKMEAIGQLSGGVAHDFNNHLVVITGYSELLLGRYLDPAHPLRKHVEEIKKAGERATRLTQQLLAFSRRQMLQPKILNLNEEVAELEKMLRRLIGENIELLTLLEPELGQIKADPGQIEQVILNLVVNARDAMPNGGKLTIDTANIELEESYACEHPGVTPGQYVLLAVSDTGMGMDKPTQARIFEPFFTTKAQGKGTGLGLATVYGIVKQSEGDIWVYSELGQGTVFKVYLPRVDEIVVAPQNAQDPLDLSGGSETILLVEDEQAVRSLSRQVLELSGYTVLEARHGEEALQLNEELLVAIDLLITDVIMPGGLNGYELAERLKLVRSEMRVLFISGYTDEAIVHHGVLETGMHFLQKPFSPNALAHKVRQILDS